MSPEPGDKPEIHVDARGASYARSGGDEEWMAKSAERSAAQMGWLNIQGEGT